jgi:hypothetical protein
MCNTQPFGYSNLKAVDIKTPNKKTCGYPKAVRHGFGKQGVGLSGQLIASLGTFT